jgi:hypothetical protein
LPLKQGALRLAAVFVVSVFACRFAAAFFPGAMPETELAATFQDLRKDLDPEQKSNTTALAASLKSLGLHHSEISKGSKSITLHARVPAGNQQHIREQREEVWEGLRQSRVKEVSKQLQNLNERDVRRLNQVDCEGIRAVDWSRDVPPVGSLGDMADFDKMMEAKNAAARVEQQRKATKLATDFLHEKKRMEDADAKLAALEND